MQRLNPNPTRSSQNILNKNSRSIEPSKTKQYPSLSPIPKEKLISRPRAVMCHICGREFGTASIEIHIKQCEKLWEEREQLKNPNQRRPVPQAPVDIPISKTAKNLNAHNEKVYEAFNQNVMVRCPNCFRTFLEDRIEIHLKSCTSENPHKIASSVAKSSEGQDIKTYVQKANLKVYESPEAKEAKEEKIIAKPKTMMCHICGREFGTASIEIHIKNCTRLWEERESKKPKKEQRPVPEMPKDLPLGTTHKDLDKRNEIVSDAFTNNVMIECPNCSRTFLEDRIEVHLKSCTSENPHRPPPLNPSKSPTIKKYKTIDKPPNPISKSENTKDAFLKAFSKPKAVMCHICGREFGTASIEIHIKQCEKLWEEREKLKPQSQRRPVPQAPVDIPLSKTAKNLNAHNEKVSEAFNQNVMARCPNCFRTFLEDRIEIHLKSCTSENPHKIASSVAKSSEGQDIKTYVQKSNLKVYEAPAEKEEKMIVKPKTVMCHICGREFGTASIEIHIKQCEKLWEEREKLKLPNQRRPVPQAPVDIPLSKTAKNLEAHNEKVYEAFNQNVMVRCPNCFRTFLEDRIEIHLKSCTSENPHKIASSVAKSSEGQDIKTYVQKANLKVYESPEAKEAKEEKVIAKPKTMMCHICGREFGTASIEIHIKNCTRLWEERESKKPKKEQRPVPIMPKDLPLGTTQKELDKRNNIVSDAFTSNVMIQCPNCFRTFLEDRIEIHLRSCTSENPHKPAPGVSPTREVRQYSAKPLEEKKIPPSSSHEQTFNRPKSLMCHICGREFGTTSIEIHQRSCAKLWEERESKKPESQRRPVPQAPSEIPLSKTSKAINAHNALVSDHYNTNTLLACPNCGRTFNEDRLQVHLRSCTSENPCKGIRKS